MGAGAARGLAHLGVLKVLKDENIPIHMIAGSSIGSIMGAFYAMDSDIDMLIGLASQLKKSHFIDLRVSKMGLSKGQKIHALIKLLTKGMRFEDLNIPLYVVAVDIKRRKGCF